MNAGAMLVFVLRKRTVDFLKTEVLIKTASKSSVGF